MSDPIHATVETAESAPIIATEPKRGPLAPLPSRVTPRRLLVAAVFIVIALLTAGALVALALTQERPTWWRQIDPASPDTLSVAHAVENGMATALTQVRPEAPAAPAGSEPWKVFITTDQANAWLSARLRGWLEDQAAREGAGVGGGRGVKWPAEVGTPQVSFERGIIRIGAMVERSTTSGGPRLQALSAVLRPDVRADGSFWCTASSVSIGRLPVPASWVLKPRASGLSSPAATSQSVPSQFSRVMDALAGRGPLLGSAIIRLADGRRVRILELDPQPGRLVITCRTESAKSAPR
ncbi:MAG: hypothetical protein IT438_04485 [Phycisphaerales bacterium]|nr:hypothetical protein [Phycisphaerales bacterium]